MVTIPKENKDDEPIEITLDARNKTTKNYLVRNEKGILVVRDEKGKIYTKKKLAKGDYVPELISMLKKNGTFNEDIEKERLGKVYEIAQSPDEFKKRVFKPKTAFYFHVTITFNGGKYAGQSVHAQSQPFYDKSQLESKRDEAMESLYMRVDEFINGDSYDVDRGKEALIPFDYNLTRRVVHYKDV